MNMIMIIIIFIYSWW